VEGAITERIDVDSFVQIYRDIDDMFEEEEEGATAPFPATLPTIETKTAAVPPSPTTTTSTESISLLENGESNEEFMEEELESAFKTLCDKDGYLSKETLMNWDEVETLIQDGLLGMDEFNLLWEQTPKSPGSPDQLDVEGFLSFNVALDDLFQFGDDEIAAEGNNKSADSAAPIEMMVEGDMTAEELFETLSTDGLVDTRALQRWGELRDMLDDGDITVEELQGILDSIPTSKVNENKFDKAGFMQFYKAIDDMFEDVDEEDEVNSASAASTATEVSVKEELLELLADLNDNLESLPCGLESTDKEQKAVLKLVDKMEDEATNMVKSQQGVIGPVDIAGTWELLYTSSSAMKFNKGLSGLGGSVPNGRFGGVKQTLKADQFLTDMEYQERIQVIPSSASFDVRVTGDWELRSSTSLFTGDPSTVLIVVPDRVVYGPTSTRADHWKSLGPLNMLDVTYLDSDLRVMRGNTSTDSIFIWRRV
jgi:hypothetical protein